MSAVIEHHPAKFSEPIMDVLRAELRSRLVGPGSTLLDPFAGTGRVHTIADELGCDSVGVELEPEWAALHPRTICGDSTNLYALIGTYAGHVDVIVTSPAYGNRFADQYLGSDNEKCRPCKGAGQVLHPTKGEIDCSKCEGSGKAKSQRMGYAISLGRKCSDGSGAAMAWGDRYRALHRRVWDECAAALAPAGLWMVNVSSFIGSNEYQGVMEWHLTEIAKRATIEELVPIPTQRMGNGQNGKARVHAEHLIIARGKRG